VRTRFCRRIAVNSADAARRRDERAFAGAGRMMYTPGTNGILSGLSGAFTVDFLAITPL
jgi:hypothetical protein